MDSPRQFDVIVLGGGIAGAAVGANLAASARVAVVEREADLGYHTTGRSAAMFIPSYGGRAVAGLTVGSRDFFTRPPSGFGGALLRSRPVMHIANASQIGRLELFEAAQKLGGAAQLSGILSPRAARAKAPILRRNAVATALVERGTGDLDVDLLHAGFLRQITEAGGVIVRGAGDVAIAAARSLWRVQSGAINIAAPVLVNATGAWADETAQRAGVPPLGLTPLRRTVLLAAAPPDSGFDLWPVVKDIDERFYFRPYGGRLLITPCDESPSPPCDAAPEELDIAMGVERFTAVADYPLKRLIGRWAGLRTFAPDRAPVVGWSKRHPGFFWLAGLGGFGIQTAPAMGRLAASLIKGHPVPTELIDHGVRYQDFAPGRLEQTRAI